MNLGIVGFGVVGKALWEYYRADHTIWTYDKATDTDADLLALNRNAEVVFICVGTPYSGTGGGLECSAVYDAVSKLDGETTVIIKSTVNPGTTDDLQAKYPQHRFFFVPEFLSELTAAQDYANPRRPHVMGVADGCKDKVRLQDDSWLMIGDALELVQWLLPIATPYCQPIVMPARQAELLKLATNAFYALKVTFANQMYDLGMTQETLDALAQDPWIVPSHFKVEHKGTRGFGGKCLPKDTEALEDYAWDNDIRSADALWAIILEYNDTLQRRECLTAPAN